VQILGVDVHLAHRDTAFVVVSRAPCEKPQAYKKCMGWSFRWLSACPGNDFPFDLQVAKDVKLCGTDMPSGSERLSITLTIGSFYAMPWLRRCADAIGTRIRG
jgi:hypothetical protein